MNIEITMIKRPEFTEEQEEWICTAIGNWYLLWKEKIYNEENNTHNLVRAKEQLKSLICGDIDSEKKDFSQEDNKIKIPIPIHSMNHLIENGHIFISLQNGEIIKINKDDVIFKLSIN